MMHVKCKTITIGNHSDRHLSTSLTRHRKDSFTTAIKCEPEIGLQVADTRKDTYSIAH